MMTLGFKGIDIVMFHGPSHNVRKVLMNLARTLTVLPCCSTCVNCQGHGVKVKVTHTQASTHMRVSSSLHSDCKAVLFYLFIYAKIY